MKRKADYVLKSRALFTSCTDQPEEGFVAITGNRIAAVGNLAQSEAWIDNKSRVFDLGDKMVLPGFFDSHVHLFEGFFVSISGDLSKAKSEEDAAQLLFDQRQGIGVGKWMTGFGWHHMHWEDRTEPSKASLDRLFPDQPVFCMNGEGHAAWVNSKALELCGITGSTPDPEGGAFVRDDNGEPTGYLLETAMEPVSERLMSEFSPFKVVKGMKRLMKTIVANGVTSVADMQTKTYNNGFLRLLEKIGALPLRVHLFPYCYDEKEQQKQWQLVQKLHRKYNSDRLRACGVKIFCDGTPLCHTGLMLQPYDDDPENSGYTLHGESETRRIIVEAVKRGYSVRAHACGDGAVKLALDAFAEVADISRQQDLRHAIEHIEVIDPADLKRFGELNVIASVQPEHMEVDPPNGTNPFDEIIGLKRKRMLWNFQSLLDANARLALGTDMPVVGIDPFAGLYRAVTRCDNEGYPEGGWLPKEKISLATALKAYTLDSAYLNGRENDLGSLEPGKLADLVVLDRDLFAAEPGGILDTRVLLTMVNGRIVYGSEEMI